MTKKNRREFGGVKEVFFDSDVYKIVGICQKSQELYTKELY